MNTADIECTFLLVATGKYIAYAKSFLESVREHLIDPALSEVLIFTDNVKEVCRFAEIVPTLNLRVFEIPAYRWPEATLLRYQIFIEHWAAVRGKIVIYVDADTRLVTDLRPADFIGALANGDLALVRHPGYYSRSLFFRLIIKTRFGPWEYRRKSLSRVPVLQRRDYVCGGVWFGRASAVKKMCCELADAVNDDLERGLIARFHDESHLNRYKSVNEVRLLDPRWAYAVGYRNLKGISPLIEVIHKPDTWKK